MQRGIPSQGTSDAPTEMLAVVNLTTSNDSAAIHAQNALMKQRVEFLYGTLDTFFKGWVDSKGDPGLFGRDMNIMLARDGMLLAQKFKTVRDLRKWAETGDRTVVPVHPDHTPNSLRQVVDLAESKILDRLTRKSAGSMVSDSSRPSTTSSRSPAPAEETLSNVDVDAVYATLPKVLQAWVDSNPLTGLCARELAILMARDGAQLARSLGSLDALARWDSGLEEHYHLKTGAGYQVASFRAIVELAKSALRSESE